MTMADVIAVNALSKTLGGRLVVRDLSLVAKPGDVVGLVGANGGGKTTTLRMLAGLLQSDTGSGHVLDVPIHQSERFARARIGYMPQHMSLYPELSVRDNLQFRAEIFSVAHAADRVRTIVSDYGLDGVFNTPVQALSGGWARRVQFVAAILHQPHILLLDEPTAGLDIKTRRDMWHWLGALSSRGVAIVVSTHDLVEAELCTTVLLYHNGVVAPQATPQELIARAGVKLLEEVVLAVAQGATV